MTSTDAELLKAAKLVEYLRLKAVLEQREVNVWAWDADGKMAVTLKAVPIEALRPSLEKAMAALNGDPRASWFPAQKMGEFNMLRCCDEPGHKGEHNYVVADPT